MLFQVSESQENQAKQQNALEIARSSRGIKCGSRQCQNEGAISDLGGTMLADSPSGFAKFIAEETRVGF